MADEFIQRFREETGEQYQDLTDFQIASAFHQKYQDDTGTEVDLPTFAKEMGISLETKPVNLGQDVPRETPDQTDTSLLADVGQRLAPETLEERLNQQVGRALGPGAVLPSLWAMSPEQQEDWERQRQLIGAGADPSRPTAEPIGDMGPLSLLFRRGEKTPEAMAKADVYATERRMAIEESQKRGEPVSVKAIDEMIGARTGVLERALKDVGSGMVGTADGALGFAAQQMGGDPTIRALQTDLQATAQDLMPADPNFGDQLLAGFGSTAAFFVPGLGVMKGAQAFAKTSQTMALWLGSGAAGGMEAAVEAGVVYSQLREEGKSHEQANHAAEGVFWANAALVTITDRFGLFGEVGGQIKRRTLAGILEGVGQEGNQQIISNMATGRPLFEGYTESVAIGGIVGTTLGGGFRTQEDQVFDELIQAISEGDTQFDPMQAALQVLSPENAQLREVVTPKETAPETPPATPEPTVEPVEEIEITAPAEKILTDLSTGEALERVNAGETLALPIEQAEQLIQEDVIIEQPVVDQLAKEIQEEGLKQPIELEEKDGKIEIANGHHRIAAMKQLGETQIPVKIEQDYFETGMHPRLQEQLKAPEKAVTPEKPVEQPKKEAVKPVEEKPKGDAKAAERVRKVADNMENQIDAKMNPAIAEQNMTPRRIRIANSMRQEGESMQQTQQILRGIAEGLETGTLSPVLVGVKTKKAADILRHRSQYLEEQPKYAGWDYLGEDDIKTLARAKITQKNYQKALKAVQAMVQGPSVEQQQAAKLRKLEQSLVGTKIPGFFPTPTRVAEHMVDVADIEAGMSVLEPSAGHGNIADVIRDEVPEADLSVNEYNNTLYEILQAKGYKATQGDFLSMKGEYDRIIMNPPFEKNQDIQHIRHAYDLLKPGGRLVSILSEHAFFGKEKQASEFRDWIEEQNAEVEDLESGTFQAPDLVRTTGVKSRIVVLDKPAADEKVSAATLYANPVEVVYDAWQRQADNALDWMTDAFGWRFKALGKLPAEKTYLAARYRTLGRIANVDSVGKKIYQTFAESSQQDQKAVYDYLTTREASADAIQSETTKNRAIAVKRLIGRVGRALVDRGLLSPEAYEAHRDAYLPRLYLKHLLDEKAWNALGSGKTVSDMGYLKQRKDIPKDVREVILGEITDPGYLASKGVGRAMRDMAILDLLQTVSAYNEWVWEPSLVEWEGRPVSVYWLSEEAGRIRKQIPYYEEGPKQKAEAIVKKMDAIVEPALEEAGKAPEDFVQVPTTARYGRLAGMYLRKEIYADLFGTGTGFSPQSSMAEKILGYGGWGTKVTQLWKMSKVALNPPTQIRNFVSNGILLHLSGVPFHRVPQRVIQSIHEIATNGKHFRIAKKWGITESTFTANELIRIEREIVNLEARHAGRLSMAQLKEIAAIVADAAGDMYQLSEQIHKTAKIIDAMEREGMSEADATMEAQKWLYDYSLIPPTVRYLRNAPVGVPFLTFYYKTAPRMFETLVKHPGRFMPYILIPVALAAMIADDYDVDEEDLKKLKKALPLWLQERGNAWILPYKDENGRWQVADIGYFLPWAMFTEALKEASEGDIGGMIQTTGVLGGPIPDVIAASKTGMDSFFRKEIMVPEDPPAKQFADLMLYLWRLSMPTFLTDKGATGHIYAALTEQVDRKGDPKLTLRQAAWRLAGVNIYPIEPQKSRRQNLSRMNFELKEIRKRMGYRLRDRNLTKEDKAKLREDYQKLIKDQQERIKEYRKESEVHPNLR